MSVLLLLPRLGLYEGLVGGVAACVVIDMKASLEIITQYASFSPPPGQQ